MEGEASRSWSCSTNWIVAEGSVLEGSISFETSEEDAAALTSNGSVLIRPESDDPSPCEVTVLLRGKHEIHRIYARTTARVFEVYFSKDIQSDMREYLCTVKCGPATSGANSSVHSSEEENWVEVKAPESSSSTDHSREIQIHYEATAEISDVDPCESLTLRFLSLQTKSSVHIEEIYVYADPLDESSTTQKPSTGTAGNFDASSMFAMFMPNLLQMSKSGSSNRINDQYFSPNRNQNTENLKDQTANFHNPVNEMPITPEPNPIEQNEYTKQVDPETCTGTETSNIKQENQKTCIGTKTSNIKQENQETSINTETNNKNQETSMDTETQRVGPTSQVEKLLEHLISKVENMETFFTKFEEKMVGPITSIETRLSQLENRFDTFSEDLRSLQPPPPTEQKDPVSQDNSVASGVTGHSRPGFRAPEFISDDDDDDDDDDVVVDDDVITVDNKRKPITIDGALASALAAFASESKDSKSNPSVEINFGDQMNDLDFVDRRESEGVPLVSIYEVKIEAVSDLFPSFEEIPRDLDPFSVRIIENESDQILGEIDGDLMSANIQGSDGENKIGEGFFCKSVIGEISDEEDLDSEPDLCPFNPKSPLSESGSESNFPTYNDILKGYNNNNNDNNSISSMNSSFDENFLKSRVQIDLSDDSSTESGIFPQTTLKDSEIGDEMNFNPLDGLFGELHGEELHGSVPTENNSGSNSKGLLIDLDENLVDSSEMREKDGNIEQFESLI